MKLGQAYKVSRTYYLTAKRSVPGQALSLAYLLLYAGRVGVNGERGAMDIWVMSGLYLGYVWVMSE